MSLPNAADLHLDWLTTAIDGVVTAAADLQDSFELHFFQFMGDQAHYCNCRFLSDFVAIVGVADPDTDDFGKPQAAPANFPLV